MRWFDRCIRLEHAVKLRSGQQLQAEAVVQVRGRGSLLGQDARPPGAAGPAHWRRRTPSREPQHSAAPTSPLCRGQAVLFQGWLDVLLRVCSLGLPDALQGSHSGGTFGRTLTAVPGWSTRIAWPPPTA